jgi:hypothetical protein
LKEGTFLIHAQQFETMAAFADQVEASVGVFFYHGDDFGGASHFGESLLEGAQDSEAAMLGEAFRNHVFVAWLEDVQGQGSGGEQNDIEWEQGDEGVQGAPVMREGCGMIGAILDCTAALDFIA